MALLAFSICSSLAFLQASAYPTTAAVAATNAATIHVSGFASNDALKAFWATAALIIASASASVKPISISFSFPNEPNKTICFLILKFCNSSREIPKVSWAFSAPSNVISFVTDAPTNEFKAIFLLAVLIWDIYLMD